ncbi:sensor domain-containing phosphodiesterase [Halomonas marinisediminis]|nr:sensor domain-containing phosphodiesterase [Halomonas marinisediminis]
MNTEDALRQLAQAFQEVGIRRSLDPLVECLTTLFSVDYAAIATVDGTRKQARTVACWARNAPAEPLCYPLSGTPCERVLNRTPCLYTSDVCERFPDDTLLTEMQVQGYYGEPMLAPTGELMGLMSLMHTRPLQLPDFAEEVMTLAAGQAGAELARQRADRQILWDSVTGLPNRRHFMTLLEQACDEARQANQPLSLLHLDIQRFKEINDLHGHEIGDRLLGACAERLQQAAEGEERVARLSGDEFSVLLPRHANGELSGAMRRYQAAMEKPIDIESRQFQMVVCIGAASFPYHAPNAQQLLQASGIALNHAKQARRHRRVFDDAMARALQRKEALQARLTRALRNQQLTLHFQPQVDLASGTLTGAEALCRWHDEEWGWVSPGEFIPLAEERGLINQLGHQVVRSACRQLKQWEAQERHFPGRLSINLSAQQLDNPQLTNQLLRLSNGILPRQLGFEITETALMRAPQQAIRITRELQGVGFSLAIDDFGTGYSSLNYLKRFAADTLKIDMTFVHDMLDSSHDRAIVSTIIAMARALGMKTVAEGVERREHVELLCELGCDQAQGFYYGRPTDADDFADRWL